MATEWERGFALGIFAGAGMMLGGAVLLIFGRAVAKFNSEYVSRLLQKRFWSVWADPDRKSVLRWDRDSPRLDSSGADLAGTLSVSPR